MAAALDTDAHPRPEPGRGGRAPGALMLVAVTAVSFVIGEVSTGIVVAADPPQRRPRHPPGAEGPGERRRAVEDAGPAGAGRARRSARAGARRRGRARATSSRSRRATSCRPTAGSSGPRRSRPRRRRSPARARRSPRTPAVLPPGDVALGDRTNMLFQNTSVTRGTASMVVTATGMETQMGQIATMLTSVTRVRSPLQKELDSLTKVLGRHRLGGGRVHRRRRAAAGPAGRRPAAARHRDGDLGHPDRHAGVRLRACSRSAPSSSPRPRRSSRTSPTSRRSARRARSTPTRPAP